MGAKRMKKKILAILIGILIILITFIIGFSIKKNESIVVEKVEPQYLYQITYDCQNLDLFNTSYCFRDNIRTFFNYDSDGVKIFEDDGILKIKTRKNNSLSIEVSNKNLLDYLKENGGDCTEWSLLYEKLCEKTEYDCDKVINGGIFNVFPGHEYAVMYNETHYCKLDQLNIKCGENK
jgi:hypothetical protein